MINKRLEQVSHRRAPVDEAMALVERYHRRQVGWNVKPFHAWYQRDGASAATPGSRTSCKRPVWYRKHLGEASTASGAPARPGMMLHQDASTHEWVPGVKWDLVVTMDDATNKHYPMRLVAGEGTAASFMGVRDVIRQRGLFASLYTDRGNHYCIPGSWRQGSQGESHAIWQGHGPLVGIEMIPAYSPEARGRSERTFRTQPGASTTGAGHRRHPRHDSG